MKKQMTDKFQLKLKSDSIKITRSLVSMSGFEHPCNNLVGIFSNKHFKYRYQTKNASLLPKEVFFISQKLSIF